MSKLKLKDIMIHPLLEKANPRLTDADYRSIKSLIEHDGYDAEKPISVWVDCEEYPNCIVDGHNRYRICLELGVEPEIRECFYPSIEHAKYAALKSASGRNMDTSQRAQWGVDLFYSQKRKDALDRMKNSNTIFKESNNAEILVSQAPADSDEKRRAPQVRKEIADLANSKESTTGFVIRVQTILKDDPEIADEIQDMIRLGELKAKPAWQFVNYPIDVVKDVVRGGAGAIKQFLADQRAAARAEREEKQQAEADDQKLQEYKESKKELQASHDAKKEQLKLEYGDDFENMGRVCVIDRGNTFEQWCEDCKNGFDAFIGTEPKHGKYHCPYCGETNTRERKPDWTPGNVGED